MKINNFFFTVQATKKLKIKNQKIKILFAKHSFILKWIIKLIKFNLETPTGLLMRCNAFGCMWIMPFWKQLNINVLIKEIMCEKSSFGVLKHDLMGYMFNHQHHTSPSSINALSIYATNYSTLFLSLLVRIDISLYDMSLLVII